MRTVTYGGAVSLDGFLAARDGSLDWLHFSKDVSRVMTDYWKDVDTVLMGRKTYLVSVDNRATASKATKQSESSKRSPRTYVFSSTLREVDDSDVEVITSDAVAFVRNLKGQPGGGICLMGGGELATSLLAAGLVDRIGLNIHPILLGSGIPTFRDPGIRVPLHLIECRTIDGGCILANFEILK